MESANEKYQINKSVNEIQIFPVSSTYEKIKENFAISTDNIIFFSRTDIVRKAVKFHSKGNLFEAAKHYQYFIDQGFQDHRVFSNYGGVLKSLGRLKEAEIVIRKAIDIKPDFAEAYSNLGIILTKIGKLKEAKTVTLKAIEIKKDFTNAAWTLYGLSKDIQEAEENIRKCLIMDENYLNAKLTMSAIKLHKGDKSLFNKLMESELKEHSYMRTFKWVSTLPILPKLFFNRWSFFDEMIQRSKIDRPFYEFGVWRGNSFRYLVNAFKKGYGFDTFEGLPEDWNNEKKGSYSAEGNVPDIEGGTFIVGKFKDTLPTFFAKSRPMASIINFDADLYSSTLFALNYSKTIIDKQTILIFDEFIINQNWEQDEYKALNEFCLNNNFRYEVLAVSYYTKQVAVKLIGT